MICGGGLLSDFIIEASRRGWLSADQVEAAARLAADEVRDRVAFSRALKVLAPLHVLVGGVACHGMRPSEWAITTKRKPEEGMVILRLGLDVLARHYGIAGADG